MRLIDADALSDKLAKMWRIPEDYDGAIREECEDAFAAIDDAPTIEAEPAVHGMWKSDGTCSECGNEADYSEWAEKIFDYDWDENLVSRGERIHRNYNLSPYCSKCGAKMDGE